MKTEDLVLALSGEDPRPKGSTPTATVALAAASALSVAFALSLAWLHPRPDLIATLAAGDSVALLKLAFTAGVVAAAFPIVRDLAVPGRHLGWRAALAATPFVVVLFLALRELAHLPMHEWTDHVDHASWPDCLWQIPALALPAFAILAIGMRHLAPTNLILVGAYIGLLSGGVGGIGYALHCHHESLAFVATAYTLAIVEMTVFGALAGPRLLRWR